MHFINRESRGTNMTIAIGSDKAGFQFKTQLIKELSNEYSFVDVGVFSDEVCDYPIYAEKVCRLITSNETSFGVLLCGSGEGMCIAANKIKGIRCGIAYNDETAKLLRNHNDANVIAFGARYMEYEEIKRRVILFVNSEFLGMHHAKRIQQIYDLETKEGN